jgi:hypothetical protein
METQTVSIAMVAFYFTDIDGCAVAGTPIRVQSQGMHLGELRMSLQGIEGVNVWGGGQTSNMSCVFRSKTAVMWHSSQDCLSNMKMT